MVFIRLFVRKRPYEEQNGLSLRIGKLVETPQKLHVHVVAYGCIAFVYMLFGREQVGDLAPEKGCHLLQAGHARERVGVLPLADARSAHAEVVSELRLGHAHRFPVFLDVVHIGAFSM